MFPPPPQRVNNLETQGPEGGSVERTGRPVPFGLMVY